MFDTVLPIDSASLAFVTGFGFGVVVLALGGVIGAIMCWFKVFGS